MVIWCKYCGHGGHAIEYEQWFKEDKKELCPHGCGHACFTADDFWKSYSLYDNINWLSVSYLIYHAWRFLIYY